MHGRAYAQGDLILPVKSEKGIDVISVNLMLENETDPVVWRGPIIANMVTQFWTDVLWKDVDFLFVDMPPGTGDVPLTVFQSLPGRRDPCGYLPAGTCVHDCCKGGHDGGHDERSDFGRH